MIFLGTLSLVFSCQAQYWLILADAKCYALQILVHWKLHLKKYDSHGFLALGLPWLEELFHLILTSHTCVWGSQICEGEVLKNNVS